MPRIISDELFEDLMQCVKAQRLLGVMGLLERVKEYSIEVKDIGYEFSSKGERYLYEEIKDGSKTNNN